LADAARGAGLPDERAGAPPAGPDPVRHVLFRVAGERYALPLEAVREVVVPQPPFARVPRASEAVRGVMNLRGRVVAVVDLAALVGLPPQPLAGGSGHVLVLERDRRALGLLVGGVLGVEALPPADGGAGGIARGVAATRIGAATLLAPDALAAEAEALFGGR
jgi:purine-binding chemotaxis protein CheW